MAQVLNVLKRGEISKGPEWSKSYGNWVFSMRADTAGQVVTVVAAIDLDIMGQAIVVVTVYCE